MEAAGLASAIITFIEFSCKLVNGTVDAYKKSGAAVDPHISNVIHDLQDVTSDITANLTPPPVASQTSAVPIGTHEQKLQALATKCKALSDELVNILKDLERKTDGVKLWRSLQAAWKALRKSEKITEIEQKLNTYRLELLLRLNMMLADKDATIRFQLDQMEKDNTKFFYNTMSELNSIQESIKKLDANVQAQASQAIHSSVIAMNLDQASALRYIREELSHITKNLETAQQQSSTDIQILSRLRYDCVHDRFDAIVDGDFEDFMRLLHTDLDPYCYSQNEEHILEVLYHWFMEGDKVLHISGKAGSGKSTLMKLLGQDDIVRTRLLEWAGTKKLVMAKFFFWLSDKNPHQNSLQGLYRSILLEILQQCPELTKIVFPRQWDETSAQDGLLATEKAPFRLIELQDAMNKLVEGFPGGSEFRFVFFIDGLDEYAAASIDHRNLARQLQSWAAQSTDIKICTSSRPHQEFHAVFNEDARINLHDLNGPDIRQFCERKLETENEGYLSQEQISQLAGKIGLRADGVFLWARLVTDTLCEGILHLDHFSTLWEKIDQAPEELVDLFLYLFNQISSVDRTQAYRLLLLAMSDIGCDANALMVTWIEKLHDPDFPYNTPRIAFTDAEVSQGIDYAQRQLKLKCRGLLEVTEGCGWREHSIDMYFRHSIRPLHRSVKDFLDLPETMSILQQQLGDNVLTSSDYVRLGIAEIKFARTYYEALKRLDDGHHRLFWAFVDACKLARLTPRALEECENLLQQFRTEPFSISHPHSPGREFFNARRGYKTSSISPGNICQNDGTIHWGLVERQDSFSWNTADMSCIHYLICLGASPDFIMGRISTGLYDKSSPDLCLVLCASWTSWSRPDSNLELLQRLLDDKVAFRDRLTLHFNYRPTLVQRIPGWVVFLVLLGGECSINHNCDTNDNIHRYAALELHILRREHTYRNVTFDFQVYNFNPGSWHEVSTEWPLITMTLEDLVLCSRPPNMDVLLCEIRTPETWVQWASRLTGLNLLEPEFQNGQTDSRLSNRILSANVTVDVMQAAFRSADKNEFSERRAYAVRKIRAGEQTYDLLGVPGVRWY